MHRDGTSVFWELRRFGCLVHSDQKHSKKLSRYRHMIQKVHVPSSHFLNSHAASKKQPASSSTAEPSADELSCSTAALLFLLLHSSECKPEEEGKKAALDCMQVILHRFFASAANTSTQVTLEVVLDKAYVASADGRPGANYNASLCSTIKVTDGQVHTGDCQAKARHLAQGPSLLNAFVCGEGVQLHVWLRRLLISSTWWLLHQVLFCIARFVERSWSAMQFTCDPLVADLPVLKTNKGNTRRLDPDLVRSPMQLVHDGVARNSRAALSVLQAVQRRKRLVVSC